MKFRRQEQGQALVLTVLSLAVMLGMAALVLDVGAWFRTDRQLQATADAAALAGAQLLPTDVAGAKAEALSYAHKNGGHVKSGDITVSSLYSPNDLITVKASKTDEGFFSKVLGIDTVNINAHAKARVDAPQSALHVAPMVVSCDHPLIKNCDGKGSPKFGQETQMDFDPMGAPAAFGMLNLDGGTGTVGTSDEAKWIRSGFDKYLPLGIYRSDSGAKFSSQNIQSALTDRKFTVLLFPVFKTLNGQGQNAEYEIIGWIGFYLTDFQVHGNSATLYGHFTTFIAKGILAKTGSGFPPSFGVRAVQLVE